MDLLNVRNKDPFKTIEALTQIRHVKAAVTLIQSALEKEIKFIIPSYIDDDNRICWAILLNDNIIEFVSTKYETKFAGSSVTINLIIAPHGNSKIRKQASDSIDQILLKNTNEEINNAYAVFANSVGIIITDAASMLRILAKLI